MSIDRRAHPDVQHKPDQQHADRGARRDREQLLAGTNLDGATLVSTLGADGAVENLRNLVVATHLPVLDRAQLLNTLVDPPLYKRFPGDVARGRRAPEIEDPHRHPGPEARPFTWRTASGWAEGFFVSSLKRMSQALEVRRLVDQLLDTDPDARIVIAGDFNADPDDVPVLAIRGDVEDTGNGALAERVLVPIENTIPAPARYTLFHQGHGQMLDHLLVTRNLLAHYRGSEIHNELLHNELLHDESAAFADDTKYPESDHAPVVATLELD